MARRRRAFHKKPRRRRVRSRAEDGDEEEDDDYIAEEDDDDDDDGEEEETPDASDVSTSDEESFQFSGSSASSDEEEVVARKRRRRSRGAAAPRKPKRRPRVSDDDEEEGPVPVTVRSRRRRSSRDVDFTVDDDDEDDEDFTPDSEDLEVISPVNGKKRSTLSQRTRRGESKGTKRRKPSAAAAAPARKRRRTAVAQIPETDDEFVVVDWISPDNKKSNKAERKKTASGRKRRRCVVDSESSDSDFVISDDDFTVRDRDQVLINGQHKRSQTTKKKSAGPKTREKKTRSVASDSSDFDFVVSEEDVKDLGIRGIPESPKPKKISLKRKDEEKGKEKEADALDKQICGICLTEEQKGTIQGVLNSCPHYFCFTCIMEWSKVESRCPVCKRRFETISKSARSDPGFGLRESVVIRIQKRDQVYKPSEEEIRGVLDPYENVVCMVCQQGGDDNLMLLCDICDSSAHTYCVGLGREVPEGNWYCEGCRSAGGSSNSRAQDAVIDHGTSSSDLFLGGIETEDLSTINASISTGQSVYFPSQSSSHGIDLNVSPRHSTEEDHGVASQTSGPRVSTPGIRATHQRLRLRLSDNRSRQSRDLFSISSNLHVQDTAVDQGTSRSHLSSGDIKTEDLSTGTHARQSASFPGQSSSLQIDLNLSPRHPLGEDHGVSTQASTLSGRRAIHHHRIRILLSSRSSQISATSGVPRRNAVSDVITSEVEQGRGAVHVPVDLNPLPTVLATERPQQNIRPVLLSTSDLAPGISSEGGNFRHVSGAKEQVQSLVKSQMKKMHKRKGISLEHGTFKEVARRSTHTILAACGVEHRKSMVAAPVRPPSNCSHDLEDGPTNLMKGCCSSCFNSFVKDVVQKLIDST